MRMCPLCSFVARCGFSSVQPRQHTLCRPPASSGPTSPPTTGQTQAAGRIQMADCRDSHGAYGSWRLIQSSPGLFVNVDLTSTFYLLSSSSSFFSSSFSLLFFCCFLFLSLFLSFLFSLPFFSFLSSFLFFFVFFHTFLLFSFSHLNIE
ncbi:hypothetical protein N658DRAFT_98985 [Parathielavia hyrcaniae]|uniref:Uncharacterized protein n=1 Tax=Parathielavia hyrcaniae TaxID=113614 RepID=A0AAN6T196_9PEZI|nr:hypothetical protein N658DRAFT_98985 [Parathielavia hyrcaniae]